MVEQEIAFEEYMEQRVQQLEAQMASQDQQLQEQHQLHQQRESVITTLRRNCQLKEAQLQQLQAELLTLKPLQNQQQPTAHSQLLATLSTSNANHSSQLQGPVAAVALLGDKLQRSKHKLAAKRQHCAALKATNSELALQLLELKGTNADLSTKLAALAAASAAAERMAHENAALHTVLADLQRSCHLASPHKSPSIHAGLGCRPGSSPSPIRVRAGAAASPAAAKQQGQLLGSVFGHDLLIRADLGSCQAGGMHGEEDNDSSSDGQNVDGRSTCSSSGMGHCYQPCGGPGSSSSSDISQAASLPLHSHAAAAAGSPARTQHKASVRQPSSSSSVRSVPAAEVPDKTPVSRQSACARGKSPAASPVTNPAQQQQHSGSRSSSSMARRSLWLSSSPAVLAKPGGSRPALYSTKSSSKAAAQHAEQVLQELQGMSVASQAAQLPQPKLRQEEEQDLLGGDEQDGDLSAYGDSSSNNSSTCWFNGSAGAPTSGTAVQQQQQYSIQRTGGGYTPCLEQPGDGLLKTAGVYNQLMTKSITTNSQGVNNTDSNNAGLAVPRVPGRSSSSTVCVPRDAVSIMQDFYRQNCCVAWPLAKAARALHGVGAAGVVGAVGSSAAAGEAVVQPLVPWQVLEGLLVMRDKVFRKRERCHLQLLKARSDKQLSVLKRRLVAAHSLPQVIEQGRVGHLKAQLDAARQVLAVRDKGQQAAVLKVAERGYHIGRQLDQTGQQLDLMAAEAQGLRARLQQAAAQHAVLLQRVADAFIAGAQWQTTQLTPWLDQLCQAVQEAEGTLAAAAEQATESCWDGMCPGMQRLLAAERRVMCGLQGIIQAAWDEVTASPA